MKSIICCCCKGGVGKTIVTANLAKALRRAGHKVGALDVDYRSPDLPYLFDGLEDPELLQRGSGDRLIPPVSKEGIPVFSLHYFWSTEAAVEVKDSEAMDDIRQILKPGIIDWGQDLDYLICDTPPDSTGTLTVALEAPSLMGVIVVCQPSRVSKADTERTICLLREKEVPILGIICNQAYLEGSGISLFDLTVADIEALAVKYTLPAVWEVPHSPNLGPYFDKIVESLKTIKPVVLKVPKPDDRALESLSKLPKLLKALRGGN